MKPHAIRWILCGIAAVLAACTVNPTTGRSQFNMINRDQEIAMGIQASPDMLKQYGGKVNNPAVQQYLDEIGHKLSAVTEKDNPSLPWEFTLLDSNVINAFSLPGGKVFMSRALAVRLRNEAELAAVLGHEVGHVTARHINDQMTHELEVGVASSVAATLLENKGGTAGQLAPLVIQLGGQSVMLRFSRGQELEADALGMRYMTRAFYNPTGMMGVMEVLQEAMKGNTTPEIFSTHPYPDSRIKAIQAVLQSTYSFTANNPDYKLNEAPYQQRLLRPLGGHAQGTGGADTTLASAGLGDPVLWCEHCREAAKAKRMSLAPTPER